MTDYKIDMASSFSYGREETVNKYYQGLEQQIFLIVKKVINSSYKKIVIIQWQFKGRDRDFSPSTGNNNYFTDSVPTAFPGRFYDLRITVAFCL